MCPVAYGYSQLILSAEDMSILCFRGSVEMQDNRRRMEGGHTTKPTVQVLSAVCCLLSAVCCLQYNLEFSSVTK
jgi:hypothetical protein